MPPRSMTRKVRIFSRQVKHKVIYLLFFIILIGVLLRLLPLNTGLDADEAVTVYLANSPNPIELINRIKAFEFAPPLYFALMSFWVHCFGDAALVMAIPSMVLGAALIPCVYLLARELFEREDIALTSAFFASISPLAVVYSREARSSALIAVMAALTFYFFVRCLKATRRPRLLVLGVSTAFMLYSNYAALVLVMLMGLNSLAYTMFPFKSIVFKHERIIGTLTFALLAFLPWMPILIDQQPFGSFPYEKDASSNLFFILTSNLAAALPIPWNAAFTILFFTLPIVAVMALWKALVMMFRRELVTYVDHHKAYTMLIANTLIPILAYNLLAPLVGSARYIMSFVFLGWILFAAITVEVVSQVGIRLARRSVLRRNLAIILLCTILISISFSDVKGMTSEAESGLRQFAIDWRSKKFKQSAVMIAPDFNAYPLIYYICKDQHGEAPELLYGFPNQITDTPAKLSGYSAVKDDRESIDKALDWIQQIDIVKAQSLVLITDESELNSKFGRAKERQIALTEAISARYPEIADVVFYKASGRSFAVRVFKLSDPPD